MFEQIHTESKIKKIKAPNIFLLVLLIIVTIKCISFINYLMLFLFMNN